MAKRAIKRRPSPKKAVTKRASKNPIGDLESKLPDYGDKTERRHEEIAYILDDVWTEDKNEHHAFIVRIFKGKNDPGFNDKWCGDHDERTGNFVAYGCQYYTTRREMEDHYQVHDKNVERRWRSVESHTYRPHVEHLLEIASTIMKQNGVKW